MSRRRRGRRGRKRGRGGQDALQGISPKAMQKALGQIDTTEIDDVEEVIIRTKDEDIILEKPEVTVMNMGQEIYNIVPQGGTKRQPRDSSDTVDTSQPKEPKEVEIKEDDVQLIVNTTKVSEEEAIQAIKDNDGDIAAAIMSLK